MRTNVGAGDVRRRARVLEVTAVEVAIDRVAVVRERGEDEVHPPVAVVVAGVDAHARLRAASPFSATPASRPTLSNRPSPRLW